MTIIIFSDVFQTIISTANSSEIETAEVDQAYHVLLKLILNYTMYIKMWDKVILLSRNNDYYFIIYTMILSKFIFGFFSDILYV